MKKTLYCIIIIVFMLLFQSCGDVAEENCVFLNEKTNLHNEYLVSVSNVQMLNEIYLLKNKDDEEKSLVIGKDCHYLEVVVEIEHQNIKKPKETHNLDIDDFKIKDHTDVKIFKNIYITSVKDGFALSKTSFETEKALTDYSWVGKSIDAGNSETLILYFEFDKTISVETTLMVLEIDFFWGGSVVNKTKKGTDIVLCYKSESQS